MFRACGVFPCFMFSGLFVCGQSCRTGKFRHPGRSVSHMEATSARRHSEDLRVRQWFLEFLSARRFRIQIHLVFRSLRTKQRMHDEKFTYCARFYPRLMALERLPQGLPTGQVQTLDKVLVKKIHHGLSLCKVEAYEVSRFRVIWRSTPAVVAEKKPVSADTKAQILKNIPTLNSYGLRAAAEYLTSFVNDSLPEDIRRGVFSFRVRLQLQYILGTPFLPHKQYRTL